MHISKNDIEYVILRGVTRLVQKLPTYSAVKCGRALGWFIYKFVPLRKSVVLQNLQRVFPEKSAKARKQIARRTYQNFGQTFIEFLRNPVRNREETLSRVIFHNEHLLREAFNAGNGTILMTGHFGNWEMLACAVVALGYPLVVIARPQRNRLVDAMINQFRQSAGVETVPLGFGVRSFLRALRQNKLVAMLADQDAHKDGVFVDFLGLPSSTAPGAAVFALKTGAEIIFLTSVLRGDGKYEAWFEKIETKDLSGLSEENIRTITQRHASTLEEKIRKWPDHWFWMHRRWKTRPEQSRKDKRAA